MRFILPICIFPLTTLAAAAPRLVANVTGMAIPIMYRHEYTNLDSTGFNSMDKRATNALPLTNFGSSYYYSAILVGTPPQYFEVVFDTGSSFTFLPGVKCDASCNGHTRFNPDSSSTSKNYKKPFQWNYLDGSKVAGDLYSDTVNFAGINVPMTLGVATIYSERLRFERFIADGMLGLGVQYASFLFKRLASKGQVADQVFSFKLSTSGGELYIGGSNSALYIEPFTYVTLTDSIYWQVTLDNIQVNGRVLLTGLAVRIDTGANYILGPASQVAQIYDGIDGAISVVRGKYVLPCDNIPTISFSFGGVSFPIPRSSLIAKKYGKDPSKCYGAIIGSLGDRPWVFGVTFLENVYTAFDTGRSQIGFAKLAPLPPR